MVVLGRGAISSERGTPVIIAILPGFLLIGMSPVVVKKKSQSKNNCFTEMQSGSEEGSYLRLIDGCITQLKARE